MPAILATRIGIAFDLFGCPNRCRHCYPGSPPRDRVAEEDLRWVVEQFRTFRRPGEDQLLWRERSCFPERMAKDMFRANQALENIKRFNFPRVCGSDQEAQAMQFLVKEIRTLGLEARSHCFKDWWVEPVEACLSMRGRRIQADPAMSLPFLAGFEWMKGEGVEVEVCGRLLLSEGALPAADKGFLAIREHCDPSIVVVPGAIGQILLFEHTPEFEAYLWAAEKPVPSAYVTRQNVHSVLDAVGEKGTLRWKSRRFQRPFCNLIVEIPGRQMKRELVVMGAHLDSFPGTVGASDDAAGCAILLEAVRWFQAHPPDRTVQFVWFTGEELDRRGSFHFVKDHHLNPSTTRLFINIDSGFEQGTGAPWIRVSEERIAGWARRWLDTEDLEIRVGETQSADVAPFQREGIPTFWVPGPSRQSAHLPTDRPETIDQDKLELIGCLSIQAATCAAQAELAP